MNKSIMINPAQEYHTFQQYIQMESQILACQNSMGRNKMNRTSAFLETRSARPHTGPLGMNMAINQSQMPTPVSPNLPQKQIPKQRERAITMPYPVPPSVGVRQQPQNPSQSPPYEFPLRNKVSSLHNPNTGNNLYVGVKNNHHITQNQWNQYPSNGNKIIVENRDRRRDSENFRLKYSNFGQEHLSRP